MFDFLFAVSFVEQNQLLIAFLIPYITGEIGINVLGLLYGLGKTTFLISYIVPTLSILLYETVVFIFVKYYLASRLNFDGMNYKVKRIYDRLDGRFKHHSLFILLVLKTIPLTKFTIFFYSYAFRKMSVLKFVTINFFVSFLYVSILFIPGYLIGSNIAVEGSNNLVLFISIYIVALLGILFFLGKYIEVILEKVIFFFYKMFLK